jgi:hypothetical protein
MKNIFYKILLTFVLIYTPCFMYAAGPNVYLDSKYKDVNTNTEFYIDLMLSADTADINGIEGNINLPNGNNVKLLRIEDGGSIVRAWLVHPELTNDKVSFSGIIPNGFSGVIDPNDGSKKKPANVIRLVLKATKTGPFILSTNDINLTLNDGSGTIVNINPSSLVLNVGENINNEAYALSDKIKPEITANIVKDENLFEGKYSLVFQAIDRQSGIKDVSVKEGIFSSWKAVSSPYLLEDQSHQSIIRVKATDNASNDATVAIYPPIYKTIIIVVFIVVIIVLALLFVRKNKKRHATFK